MHLPKNVRCTSRPPCFLALKNSYAPYFDMLGFLHFSWSWALLCCVFRPPRFPGEEEFIFVQRLVHILVIHDPFRHEMSRHKPRLHTLENWITSTDLFVCDRDASRDWTCDTRVVVWSIHRTTVCGLVLNLSPGIVSGTSWPHVCHTCGRGEFTGTTTRVVRHPWSVMSSWSISVVCECTSQEHLEGHSCNSCMIVHRSGKRRSGVFLMRWRLCSQLTLICFFLLKTKNFCPGGRGGEERGERG
jgi:hypothetical protein